MSSVEMIDGTKSYFKSWTASVENTAQISMPDIIHIAFSKKIGPSLSSGHRLKHCLPYLMWQDLKSKPSRQYSKISFNSHATQVFACLQQGSDELLEMYLHHASELSLKIHHTTDMAEIPAEGLNHYTVVYSLNSANLKDKLSGH